LVRPTRITAAASSIVNRSGAVCSIVVSCELVISLRHACRNDPS